MDIGDLLKNSDKLKEVLRRAIWDNDKKLAEALIPVVKDPELTYLYAFEIVQGKIKDEWEDIIAQDPLISYNYASRVLKRPFPKGEDIIAQDPYASYHYAKDVLKGPFPKGEDIIATNRDLSYYYAKKILKGPFPKGEEYAIAQDLYASYYYARDVLKGPFPKGEDAISENSELSYAYAQNILKDRFKKGEETIINDKKVLKEYMKFLKQIGKLDEFLEDHPEVKKEN